jgi:hypothetical protein
MNNKRQTMEKHFEFTDETAIDFSGNVLHRIRCTRDIPGVKKGTLGGWVEKQENLSGDAWVCSSARVFGNAWVRDDARVYGNAWLSGDARVHNHADYCCFQSFGRYGRTTTASRDAKCGVRIVCGCFSGTLEEFEKRVEETHGNSQYGLEYKAVINVLRVKFNL